jgi:hypothetical protein
MLKKLYNMSVKFSQTSEIKELQKIAQQLRIDILEMLTKA